MWPCLIIKLSDCKDYLLRSESRSHHSEVTCLKVIVKCPLVNILDTPGIKTILGVFRICVNCFKPENGVRINNIHLFY